MRNRVNCTDFVAEVGNLLDNEVSQEVRAHLEEHLAGCKACEVVYDSTRKTISIVSRAGMFHLTTDQVKSGTQSIMARIREMKGT